MAKKKHLHLKKRNKLSGGAKAAIIVSSILAVLLTLYLTFVFSDNAFISKWRSIYIETAMTTMSHQWLATAFIPNSVVEEVMNAAAQGEQEQGELQSTWDLPDDAAKPGQNNSLINTGADGSTDSGGDPAFEERELFYDTFWELDREAFENYLSENPDILKDGYFGIVFKDIECEEGLSTTMDEPVCVLDAVNNLLVVKVSGDGYEGKLAVVKDSSQVELLKSPSLGDQGTVLSTLAQRNGAILAINASGFADIEWKGNGGFVIGSLVIDGVDYGNPNSEQKLFGFKEDGYFYIDNYSKAVISEYRWAIQFKPALIVDGEVYVQGTYGYGLQPRSAIGQARNGDVLLLIVDGRQVGHSIGCTVSDLAEIMLRHDAYQAMNLDGGSSSLMWYDGEGITSPSSKTNLGRYLPDAIAVMPANRE